MVSSSNSPQGMSIRDGLDRETAETLKWFARLLGGDKRIIRKAELISLIAGHLEGDQLRELWRGLDHIQQAALAETIHSQSLKFDEARFMQASRHYLCRRLHRERVLYCMTFQ